MSNLKKMNNPRTKLPFSDILALSSIMLVGYYIVIVLTSFFVGLFLSKNTSLIVSNLIENHNPFELPSAIFSKVISISDSAEKWIILAIIFVIGVLLQTYAESVLFGQAFDKKTLDTNISLRVSVKHYQKLLRFELLFTCVWAAVALVWFLFSSFFTLIAIPPIWADAIAVIIALGVLTVFLPARVYWLYGSEFIESLHLSIQTFLLYAKLSFPAIIASGALFTVVKRLFLASSLDVRLEVWIYLLPILTLVVFFCWCASAHRVCVAFCNHKNSLVEPDPPTLEKEDL